jgi:hypothetical protein
LIGLPIRARLPAILGLEGAGAKPDGRGKMAAQGQSKGRINWLNGITVISAAVLIGTEIVGAGIATGWAIAGFFSLGDIGAYVLEALFGVGALAVVIAFVRSAVRIEPLVER